MAERTATRSRLVWRSLGMVRTVRGLIAVLLFTGVVASALPAHVHSVITDPRKLRDGYDTVVDVQVPSGGQKRLIALARCLLRRPEVLLLDEPTENLDADQRARLTGVIRGYARDRTCVVISHDMDFIAAVADRILVLEHGRIAQVGNHRELIAEGGLYKRLYEAQNIDPNLVYPTELVAR